jgi:NTE family protein
MTRDAVELLLKADLLRGVSEAQLRAISPPPQWVAIAAGETLIRQGEPGAAFYFLVHGRLRVFVEHGGQSRQVGEVLPGEGVGEMALLTDELTSATVRVMHDSSLIRFSRES